MPAASAHAPTSRSITRRHLLAASAAAAAAVALSACSKGTSTGPASTGPTSAAVGSAKDPLPTPATLHESPGLAAKVKAGSLPPLEKRLPATPYVLPHSWVRRGTYGGQLSMNVNSTSADSSVAVEGPGPLQRLPADAAGGV